MEFPAFLFISALVAGGTLVPASEARAANIPVTNCNNNGAGSLRAAFAAAADGDVIDLRALSCNRIVLTSGAIVFTGENLTVRGPGWRRFTVSGDGRSSVFRQARRTPAPDPGRPQLDSTFRLQGFTIAWGRHVDPFAVGGCVFAFSRVVLDHMQVHHCTALATSPEQPSSGGGAVFAHNDLLLIRSHVHSSRATPSGNGGGVYTNRMLTLDHSRISHNRVDFNAGGAVGLLGLHVSYSTIDHNMSTDGPAGGFATAGPTWINKSTIAYNHAHNRGAGEFTTDRPTRIIESTISHNTSDLAPAGFAMDGRFMPNEIRNSTIAFNSVAEPGPGDCFEGGGIAVAGPIRIQSSIIAGNTCAGAPSDVGRDNNVGEEIVGTDNLIGASSVALPPDTLPFDDPRLAPLATNGGPTLTHLPLADSPAIDAGSNPSGFQYDQRGPGFPRSKGGGVDIGAVER